MTSRGQAERDPAPAETPTTAAEADLAAEAWAQRVRDVFAALGVAPDREVGRQLRRLREEARLPQRYAASFLPLDQSKISRTESGLRRLSLLEAAEVSLLLGVPIEELLPEPVRALYAADGGSPAE